MAPSTWSIKKIVADLSDRKQAKALLCSSIESDPNLNQMVIHGISAQWDGRFREVFVARKGIDWQAETALLALNATSTHSSIEDAFQTAYVNYVMDHSVEMITEFLDGLDVKHDGIYIENPEKYQLDLEDVSRLVISMREKYADEDICLYLALAGLNMPSWSVVLWSTLDLIEDGTKPKIAKEVSVPEEVLPEPVIPELSTILDDIITRAIVASVAGEEGTPPTKFIEDAIDELITLNTNRARSYFHRGYFHALVGSKDQTPSLEQNEERRQWELAGKVFGLARRTDADSLLDCWNESSDEIILLMDRGHGAGPRILPLIWKVLWESEKHSDALRLLRPEVLINTTVTFKKELLENAKSHRRVGLVDEARVILDALVQARVAGEDAEDYTFELLRERAVCIRTQGLFEEAASLIDELIDRSSSEQSGDLHALLGLCKGKFRTVSEVTCLVEEDQLPVAIDRLREQVEHFQLAFSSEQRLGVAIGGHCLGVLAFLEAISPNRGAGGATGYLSKSQSAALLGRQSSSNRPFVDQIQIALALSIIEENEQSRFNQAVETLGDLQLKGQVIPDWIAKYVLDLVSLIAADDNLRNDLLTLLIKFAPASRDYLIDGTHDSLPATIVREIRAELDTDTTSLEDKWKYGEFLSDRYVATSDLESTRECLDHLERIAVEHPRFRPAYADLFEVEGRFGDAWIQEDVAWSLAGMYEKEGRYEDALQVLRQPFHSYASDDSLVEAFGVLDRVKHYGLASEMYTDMESRLVGLMGSPEFPEEADPNLGTEQSVKVLFVGGHEPHKKYDAGIKANLLDEAPWISVDFEHPGWSTNWTETAETLISRFHNYDALVIMTLIRTNLGKTLRKNTDDAGLVWVSCTGAGRSSIAQAIRHGAQLAVRNKIKDT